ncbi:tRNA methyltransferase ppm2 [Neopestalotiopsis sp. 37M]|nr:tRNA methyltransferase ppm2 [Neopestalotiopsis sp. 37M]
MAKTKKKPEGRSPKERAQDDLVMSTNSSSIVSKRSVERIYYPDEPHFFRFFVKKFQRRSPLINRGYHLRLHVIDVAVRNFLQRPSPKRKVVINLGAGLYPDACKNAKFIDIDFPDLMEKKRKVIQETAELNSMLTHLDLSADPLVFLQSDEYIQMGCDLRDLDKIQQSISQLVDLEESEFIFVAEVSITYMETVAADAVIKWANSLGQAEFCLLEQILPDGAEHPFAETMLRHFEKLKTPLKSVTAYPTLQSQNERFTQLGWPSVHVETLWSTWSSDTYLTTQDRKRLNDIEPFDEWEEFAVFGGHYCVVSATNRTDHSQGQMESVDKSARTSTILPSAKVETRFNEVPRTCQRRFGASMMLQDYGGQQYAAEFFGLGNTSRLSSVDIYGQVPANAHLKPTGPPSRMCHTIVDLGLQGNLLVGGRASPSAPLKDSWIYDKIQKSWRKDLDLPMPLYRHAATRLGHSSLALVIGGKTGPSAVFDGCLLYVPEKGWLECEIMGQPHTPVFGAVVASTTGNRSGAFGGILIGGLLEDGTLARQNLRWELQISNPEKPTIRFSPMTVQENQYGLLDRFGATAVMNETGRLVVIGGIVKGQMMEHHNEILLVGISDEGLGIVSTCQVDVGPAIPRPLLLGMSAVQDAQGQTLLTGGGATCFSMGTYWNKGYYVLSFNDADIGTSRGLVGDLPEWVFIKTLELTGAPAQHSAASSGVARGEKPAIQTLPRVQLASSADFDKFLKAGQPVVIEKASLGSCVSAWTAEYLVSKIGSDRSVVVHESATAKMDFNSKNFKYVTKEFGCFIDEAEKGGRMYLRALSEEKPADKPANLAEDFPSLAEDFVIPPELSFVAENTFSSVLRISGLVNMWLHYDVMANIYCQIAGTKRLVLFPPGDVTELSFAPGASSSSLDVFAELDTTSLANTRPHEAVLGPGDILFLPPLWLHTAAPVSGLGVAVNVFFRNLDGGYSAGRDVYGNRDLAAYEKGRQDVAKIASGFGKVPVEMKEFYVKRLASELLQKLQE